MYVCMYVYIYIYMSLSLSIYIYIHMYIHVCVYIYIYTRKSGTPMVGEEIECAETPPGKMSCRAHLLKTFSSTGFPDKIPEANVL